MENLTFSKAINKAWDLFTKNFGIMILVVLAYYFVYFLINIIFSSDSGLFFGSLLSFLLNVYFGAVFIQLVLQVLDKKLNQWSFLKFEWRTLLQVFVANLVLGVIFTVAMIPVIILTIILTVVFFVNLFKDGTLSADFFQPSSFLPILILFLLILVLILCITYFLGTRLQFVTFYLVDKNADVMESIEKSWKITKNHKTKIFIWIFLTLLINIFGFTLFGIASLVTLPVTQLILALLYRDLLNKYKEV